MAKNGVCALIQRYFRQRNCGEDLGEKVVWADVVGECFIGENEAMAQNVECEVSNVMGQAVVAAPNKGEGLGREDQVDRCTWTRSVCDVGGEVNQAEASGVSRAVDQLHGVVDKCWIDVNVVDSILECNELVGVDDLFESFDR